MYLSKRHRGHVYEPHFPNFQNPFSETWLNPSPHPFLWVPPSHYSHNEQTTYFLVCVKVCTNLAQRSPMWGWKRPRWTQGRSILPSHPWFLHGISPCLGRSIDGDRRECTRIEERKWILVENDTSKCQDALHSRVASCRPMASWWLGGLLMAFDGWSKTMVASRGGTWDGVLRGFVNFASTLHFPFTFPWAFRCFHNAT